MIRPNPGFRTDLSMASAMLDKATYGHNRYAVGAYTREGRSMYFGARFTPGVGRAI